MCTLSLHNTINSLSWLKQLVELEDVYKVGGRTRKTPEAGGPRVHPVPLMSSRTEMLSAYRALRRLLGVIAETVREAKLRRQAKRDRCNLQL